MNVASKRREASAARPLSKQRLRLWIRLLRAARGIEVELRERLRKEFAITLPGPATPLRCHLPKWPVAYPASFTAWAMVISPSRSGMPGQRQFIR